MAKTKIVRIDANLSEMLEMGRRQMQIATGQRISIAEYTAMLSQFGKPFMPQKKLNLEL